MQCLGVVGGRDAKSQFGVVLRDGESSQVEATTWGRGRYNTFQLYRV